VATHVERSIEVAVPVRIAYDQWTQFEDFPRFMSGVQEVRQISNALTHWVAEIAGVKREWDAAILEQVPDQKVAWAATTGATNAGAVYFQSVGTDRTQVRLTLDFEPEGVVERVADVLDMVERQAIADLDRFKAFIESRGSATGAWRGTVEEGDVPSSGTGAAGAATAGRAAGADIEGDLVAVGPTGGTRSTMSTEAGPPRAGATPVDTGPGVGHSGDPVAVEPQASRSAGTGGPTADAATSSSTGVAGFGTNTGLSSDDPASGVVTGNPDPSTTRGTASTTGGPTANAATSSATGVAGFGTNTGLSSDDPASGVVTGNPDPGAGTSTDATTGSGERRVASGMGGAQPSAGGVAAPRRNPEPSSLDAADAPGPADGVGAALDPRDPRSGTADDPDNPQRPSV
jgi:hypothetical protein